MTDMVVITIAGRKKNENADRVGSNRMLEVEGGYYYRVFGVFIRLAMI